jgi:hypothetical protein
MERWGFGGWTYREARIENEIKNSTGAVQEQWKYRLALSDSF